jgi:DNA-binding NtrC family response regulator
MFDAHLPGNALPNRFDDRSASEIRGGETASDGKLLDGKTTGITRVFLGMPAVIVSEPMTRLLSMVERVSRSTATVLITGESGSGKEIIARAVHHYSPRAHKPWVDLSCAALPEHLIESELFGYDRGAFSGADSNKQGLFELAHQGTIFLDEIGELEPKMQVKLLRVLDGAPYYRLGGTKKITVDVRVVAATNQELEIAVAEGRFRSDLYHRLSQITLRVPPLRKRAEDIGPLANYFLEQQDPRMRFSMAALDVLVGHSWPGNIRELRNVVIKAALLAQEQVIVPEDLPPVMHPPAYGVPYAFSNGNGGGGFVGSNHGGVNHGGVNHGGVNNGAGHGSNSNGNDGYANGSHQNASYQNNAGHNGFADTRNASIEGMERRMILEALRATGGHQQKAAMRLGISRRTLSRKLKLYESENAGAVV